MWPFSGLLCNWKVKNEVALQELNKNDLQGVLLGKKGEVQNSVCGIICITACVTSGVGGEEDIFVCLVFVCVLSGKTEEVDCLQAET